MRGEVEQGRRRELSSRAMKDTTRTGQKIELYIASLSMFVLFAHISVSIIILYSSSFSSPPFSYLVSAVWSCSICINIFEKTLYFLKKKSLILNKLSIYHY